VGSTRRRIGLLGPILLACLGGSLLGAAPAAAADPPDQLEDVGRATYELVPAKHVVHVTVAFDLTNKKPSRTTTRDCSGVYVDPYYGPIPYTASCRYRTDYYYYSYSIFVEADAVHVAVKTSSGTASVKLAKPKGSWREATIHFSNLYFGSKRRLTLSYDLPAGGPRSKAERRGGYGYTSFCAWGPSSDLGSIRIILPSGFRVHMIRSLPSIAASGHLEWASKTIAKPWQTEICLDGPNDELDATTTVAGPDGATVSIRAWRDDPAWAEAMHAAAERGLPKLVDLLGPLAGSANLTIEEHPDASGPDSFTPGDARLKIAESHATEADGVRRLALLWFDDTLFEPAWLRDGSADWAALESGAATQACTKPGAHPNGSRTGVASAAERFGQDTGPGSVRAWERQAGCYVVKTVADAIGRERMLAAIATLRHGGDPYGIADPSSPPAGARTWREWLDVVELQGLVPAGADRDLAARLLAEYGAATSPDLVAARRSALTAYDALVARIGSPPAVITEAMRAWSFDAAQKAITAASTAWDESEAVLGTFRGLDGAPSPVRTAVSGSHTQADLDAAVLLGQRQVALAKDAADARATLAASRDLVQSVGLLGRTLPADADLVRAVGAADEAAAAAWTSQVRAQIGGARDLGIIRIVAAIGTVVGLGLLTLAVRWLRRRSRRRRAAAAVSASATGPADPPEPGGS
jgi:hypothetical protein